MLRLLLALLVALAGVFSASTAATGAATTSATAAAYTYDLPAVARVHPLEFISADASPTQLSDVREPSASPLVGARGTSTTLALTFVATNTRMSGATTVGETDLATSNMRKFSTRNPEPGYYDVVGHGSPSQLAERIRTSSGGQNARLLSCQTGCPSGTFAQDLADDLGARVMAPTTDIGASNSGKTLTIFDGGEWRWFEPR